MGFYQEPIATVPARRGGVKIRVRNHDSLGDIMSLIASRGITPSAPVNTSPVSVAAPMLPPATLSPSAPSAPPVSPLAPTPTPTAPGGVFQLSTGVYRYTPFSPTGGSDPITQAAQAAQTASPIIGAVAGPAAGAVAALAPAVSNALATDGGTQVRFDTTSVGGGGDLSMPEVYNPDGTPVTPAAKAATLIDKVKALPPAAKIGGAVLLYILFSHR